MRYLAQKSENVWAVWDTELRAVADVDGQPALQLTEATAMWIAKTLNQDTGTLEQRWQSVFDELQPDPARAGCASSMIQDGRIVEMKEE